jgi:ABC-type multidrug transport system fused ATPase/permease subunit
MSADARYRADTLLDLYRATWQVTGRQQLLLITLAVTVAALVTALLKCQQLFVNSLVGGGDIQRIAWLCAGVLGATLLSAALKFALNYRVSVMGERIVLLLRERLYAQCVGRPAPGAAGTPKRGTLVTMLAAERVKSGLRTTCRTSAEGSVKACLLGRNMAPRRWRPAAPPVAAPALRR